MTLFVTKRDGSREAVDVEKFNQVLQFACENIKGVSASQIALHSQVQFYDGMTTAELMEISIKSAADLISEDTPNYQWAAGRLINYHIRKTVYGRYEPWHLQLIMDTNIQGAQYDEYLAYRYSVLEINELNSHIDHDRDFQIAFAGMEQWRGKYLVKNRGTGQIYETPQIAIMLIAMTLFAEYRIDRLKWVKDFYDAVSNFDISLPTPIMAGVRTPQRQFSSCVLVETDDSLDSINQVTAAIVKYVSQKAGIGIGAGRIRAIGSAVRNGDTRHTGVIPFYKLFAAAVKSCSQGGVRGGSATLYYPIWHLEAEELLVLKNNKGTEETRIRHMDYGIQFNKLMYERLMSGGNITLFSPSDVPGLYDAFFEDQDKFRELYEAAEKNDALRKKTLPAIDLFAAFMQERKDTGRVYLMNVDHVNEHSSFKTDVAAVYMSNLCCEITLPTTPLDLEDQGEIALCTLAAINWGKIKEPKDFEVPCRLAVRALDALLSFQNYPVKQAEWTKDRRALGIGIVNFAYWLAKNNLRYNDEALPMVHEWAEAWSYYLIKASVDLAMEQERCGMYKELKYSQGLLPIDTYKRDVDELVKPVYKMDWTTLREDMVAFGIRNSTLMALMPSETSSQISNSTNGIEPPRALVSVKQSKDGVLKQVVPEVRRLKNKYDLLWDQESPEGYLKVCAVLQKFVDQAISVNTSYNPKFYEDEKIPLSDMLRHVLMHYKYGGKTLYYFNTNDASGEYEAPELPITETDEESCDSCIL